MGLNNMRVLPDINAAWESIGTIPVPSYLPAAKANGRVYCVNGMPTFVWPVADGLYYGRFVILQIASDGTSVMIEDFIPMGLNSQAAPLFYIYDNTIITTYLDSVIRSQFAFDPVTGLIASVHPAIPQAGFNKWCMAGGFKSLKVFPAALNTPLHLYGTGWGGGTEQSSYGSFIHALYPERGKPSTNTWTATQGYPYDLANYCGPTYNGYIDEQRTPSSPAIALNQSMIAFTRKESLNSNPNYYITIKLIRPKEEFNPEDCTRNVLSYTSTDVLDINMYDVYGPHFFGGTLYSTFPTNYYSLSTKANGDTGGGFPQNDWVIYIKYPGTVIQRMVLNYNVPGSDPSSWPTFVYDDGTVLKIGTRMENGNFIYLYKANVAFDTSRPQFTLPAFPIQPAPVRSSDLRTLYRSK